MKVKLSLLSLLFCFTTESMPPIKNTKPTAQPKLQLVEVKNCITKEKLGYNKFFCTHYPDKFYLKINGKKLKTGETITAKINEQLTVEYGYEWTTPIEKKIGAKKTEFEIVAGAKKIEIDFADWNNKQRITASSCTQKTTESDLSLETILFSNDDVYS